MFAEELGALTQITDAAFAEYRVPPDAIAKMRLRFADWRQQLLAERQRLRPGPEPGLSRLDPEG
jgi:hypothetical protein